MPRFDGSPDQRLALNAWVKLARAAGAIGGRLAEPLAGLDLTESQFGVLDALYHLGPLHQGELARKILRTSGNVTLVVDNLERRGLVSRVRREDDRRYIEVRLTAAGEALIRRIFPRHAERVAREFGVLSVEERRQLVKLCRRLIPNGGDDPRPG